MSDMYREYERVVTGKSGQGLSFLGWLALSLGALFVLGVVGVGAAAFYVRNRVQEFSREYAQEFSRDFDVESLVAAEVVGRMESHARLVGLDPEEGLDFLQTVPMDGPPEEFFREMVTGDSWRKWGGEQLAEAFEGMEDRRSLSVKGDDGAVSIDVVKGKDGGSLVIGSEDGQVRFDLVKTGNGGFLTINSESGEVRFDLVRGDNGGELTIRSDEGTLRFGAGEAAESMPGWVPRMDGMPGDPRGVYSLASREGLLGAVTWQSDDSTEEVLRYYQDLLVRDGYDLKARHRLRDTDRDHRQASLWARNEESGRMVFVLADENGGETKVLLGYGEERD